MFGDAGVDYVPSSKNTMIEAPKAVHRPEKKMNDAQTAKAKELYGRTADVYGFQKGKKDGALMTSAADWKNSNMQMTNKANTSNKTGENGLDSRDRKFQQL